MSTSHKLADFFHNTPVQVILTILVILSLQILIRDSIGRIVERTVRSHKHKSAIEEKRREETLTKIFRTASAVALWTIGIVVILWQLHVNIAALLTGAGVVGVVIGFGAQNVIKDFLAGIFIIVENQYRVGDIITLSAGTGDGVSGMVEDITIRITRLRDLDGNLHIVPHGSAGIITNRSFDFANVNIDVNVAYEADIAKVEKTINDVGLELAKDAKWRENCVEPVHFLRVDNFGDSALLVKSLGKVQPGMQWDVAGEFRRRLKIAFEQQDIAIGLPQIVVHQPSTQRAKK